MYADYSKASLFHRSRVVKGYLRGVGEMQRHTAEGLTRTFEAARAHLLPRVREAFYHEVIALMARREGLGKSRAGDAKPNKPPQFAVRPYAAGLTLELVEDLPESVAILPSARLDEWGISFDDVLAIARDNLWRLSNKNFIRLESGLFVSAWQDTHDASRLFLHDLIWQLPVRGGSGKAGDGDDGGGSHVAMVPSRNLLLVAGAEDEAALLAMAALAESTLQQETRPMTGVAYRLNGSSWAPFLPPPASAAHWPLRKLAMRTLLRQYEEQAELLKAIHVLSKEDIFVAGHHVIQSENGTWYSWTSWVGGVTDALMPRADLICIGAEGDPPGWVPFAMAERIAGSLMERTSHEPPRFRVRRYPSPEQMTVMKPSRTPHEALDHYPAPLDG
jgi:hypothetical protein